MARAAFVGEFETPVTIRLLGEDVIRNLKVEYGYTPRWPYYSARRRAVRQGEYQFGLGICVLLAPDTERGHTDPPSLAEDQWALSQLLAIGVLKPDLHERVRAHVDSIARRQDRENREAAGLAPDVPNAEAI